MDFFVLVWSLILKVKSFLVEESGKDFSKVEVPVFLIVINLVRWWACTRSGVWGRYSGSFENRPTSSRWVPRSPTITKHSQSLPNRPQATEGCSAALGSVRAHVTYLPWPHKSHQRSLTIFYYGIGIRQPVRLMLSGPSQFLSFIFPTSTCSVEHNLAPSLGHPSRTFTIYFFSLVLQCPYLLLTLGRWILNVQDFVIFD